MKVIKREINQATALAVGRECRKQKWQIQSRPCTPAAGCADTAKMVYWCCSSNISGSQLFDHRSDIICFSSVQFTDINSCTVKGNYELRPAVKNLYQLQPKVTALSVSVASRVASPKHDVLRPAISKELHRKLWVYKMSNNWKVLSFILKVKQSRYRLGVAQRVQEVKVPRFHDNGIGWW